MKTPKIIYLSGPITGDKNFQIKFRLAKRLFCERFSRENIRSGFIHNPAENQPLEEMKKRKTESEIWAECMYRDVKTLTAIRDGDGYLILLPGWENSKGACFERKLAVEWCIPIREIGDLFPEWDERLKKEMEAAGE